MADREDILESIRRRDDPAFAAFGRCNTLEGLVY